MPSDLQRLEDQLRRTFGGGAWHGPSISEVLHEVTAEQAFVHPVPGAHSIWELILHLNAAYSLVLRRLQGDSRQLTAEEDWPPVPHPSESNWQDAIQSLRDANGKLREAIGRFDPENLDKPLIADPPYSAFTQFIGITQHDLYHAGQIAILRKMAQSKS